MTRQPNPYAALAAHSPAAANKLLEELKGKVVIPHAGGQQQVVESAARFIVLRAGRRWGKTKLAARQLVLAALKPDSMVWWVANTYKNVRRGYREVLRQIPRSLLAKEPPPPTSNELSISLKNGTTIEFYSGGNPDAMAGEGVDFVVIDEAALIPQHVWYQIIRPTLMDSQGGAILISTPRGRNWFWGMHQRGIDPEYPAYASFHFTSYDNPHIPNSEIDEYVANNPSTIVQQEVYAEFLSNAAAIFNMDKARVREAEAVPRGHVVLGVDLAKKDDFTVLTAARLSDREPVYHDRFNTLSWPDQKDKIVAAVEDLEAYPDVTGVTVGVDTTGIGDAIFDDLDVAGIDVEPVMFSPMSKPRLVKRLAADLERGDAAILEAQVPEFEAYEYKITPSGNFQYEAAGGAHDDEVAAKMIENWIITQKGGGAQSSELYDDPEAEEEASIEDGVVVTTEHEAADTPGAMMARDEVWGPA